MNLLILADTLKSLHSLEEEILDDDSQYKITTVLVEDSLDTLTREKLHNAIDYDLMIIDIKNHQIYELERMLQSINFNIHLEEIVVILIVDSIDEVPQSLGNSAILDYLIRPYNRLDLLGKLQLHRQYKSQIKKSTYLKSRALEATANAITITDKDGNLLWLNSAFTYLTGYEKNEAIGKNPRVLKSDKQHSELYKELWSTILSGQVWHGELINKRKNGSEYYEEMTITPLTDDIGDVTHFIAVKQNITERKEREQQVLFDLNLARQVQKGALSKPIINDQIQINGVHISSEELSGDMYAWYPLDEYRFGIILYDVMGHGLSAALITMSIRSLLRGIITSKQDPLLVIKDLNEHICNLFNDNQSFSGFYFTSIYMVVDIEKRTIEYVNAGHPPAIVIDDQGSTLLMEGSLACGIFENIQICKGTIKYQGNAKICLFTDGLLEAVGMQNSEFVTNSKFLIDALTKLRETDNQEVLKAIRNLIDENNTNDDICFISVNLPVKR